MMPPTTRSSIAAAAVFGSNHRNVHIIIFISTVKITLLSIDMLSWSSISSSFFSLGSFLLERKIMFNMTEQISEEMRVGIPTQLIKHLQKIKVLLICEKLKKSKHALCLPFLYLPTNLPNSNMTKFFLWYLGRYS